MSKGKAHNKMHPGLKKVLEEMCKRVGVDFNQIDFTKKNWFQQYSWTPEEQEDFVNWLAKQIKLDKDVRAIFNGLLTTDLQRKNAALMFVFEYGWKTKHTKEKDQNMVMYKESVKNKKDKKTSTKTSKKKTNNRQIEDTNLYGFIDLLLDNVCFETSNWDAIMSYTDSLKNEFGITISEIARESGLSRTYVGKILKPDKYAVNNNKSKIKVIKAVNKLISERY